MRFNNDERYNAEHALYSHQNFLVTFWFQKVHPPWRKAIRLLLNIFRSAIVGTMVIVRSG